MKAELIAHTYAVIGHGWAPYIRCSLKQTEESLAGTAVYPQSYPATRKRLEKLGIPLAIVDVSELAKAEGAVTCCSILFNAD